MAREINQNLRKAAEASALRHSVMPVFVCDENFHLCMYSVSLTSVMPRLVIGKDMSVVFSPDTRALIENMPDGCETVMLDLPQYKNSALVVVGRYEDSRYIAIILDGNAYLQNLNQKPYLGQAGTRVAQAIDELLHSPSSDQTKLSVSCEQLNRLRRYAQFSDPSSANLDLHANACTELIPYIRTIAAEFNRKLASIGGMISLTKSAPLVYFCDCPPIVLGAILSTLISAAVCLSQDGMIELSCCSAPQDFKTAHISIVSPNPPHNSLPSSFDLLIEHLHVLKLDLLAVKDIADRYRLDLQCRSESDGAFGITLSVPFVNAGKVTFHSPSHSFENVFTSVLIDQLFAVICSERETAQNTNSES